MLPTFTTWLVIYLKTVKILLVGVKANQSAERTRIRAPTERAPSG